MAKITITKRIDLSKIIKTQEWQDTYLIVRACSGMDVMNFQRKTSAKIREVETLQLEYQKNPSKDLGEKIDNMTISSVSDTYQFIKERLVSGYVFDDETQTKVQISQDDIDQMPIEIIKMILSEIMEGGDTKKN